MRRDRHVVALTWYRTAERDLRVARAALDLEPSLAAFHAQQAAEKALKAALVLATDDHPRTHTAGRLVRELRDVDPDIGADIERDATALDLYYLTSRYPDAVGDEDPGAVIAREDADIALARAERISGVHAAKDRKSPFVALTPAAQQTLAVRVLTSFEVRTRRHHAVVAALMDPRAPWTHVRVARRCTRA